MSKLFSCCFPLAAGKAQGDRQHLLTKTSNRKSEEDVANASLDLRRVFSRNDISAIPEHSEVHRGEETNHPVVTPTMIATADPPPSPLPGPPQKDLERLFSRGATKNSPVALNRLFSRGAIPRTASNLSTGWSQRDQREMRSSTADSTNEDYGEDRLEPFGEGVSPLNTARKAPSVRGSKLGEFSQTAEYEDEKMLNDGSPSPIQLAKQSSASSVRSFSSRKKFPELAEAIKKLRDVSDHLVAATIRADTGDHMDHTFSGIYFDIKARTVVPYQFLEIQAISIRGELGLISVYSTEKSYDNKETLPNLWTRHFGPTNVAPSLKTLKELVLDVPIRLSPGTQRGLYIHSEKPGDLAIVYDNQRSLEYTYEDNVIRILNGVAHTSNVPFSARSQFGNNAFRKNRSFVGSVRYGIKTLMWTPEVHHHFPFSFREAVMTLMCCQFVLAKKPMTIGSIPEDVLFKIINMIPADWFPVKFSSLDSDDEEVNDEQPFQYGGHVGRIAELRHLFDTAREQTVAASSEPVTKKLTIEDLEGDSDYGGDVPDEDPPLPNGSNSME